MQGAWPILDVRAHSLFSQLTAPLAQGKLWRRAAETGSSWEVDGHVLHIVVAKAVDSLGSWPMLLQVGFRVTLHHEHFFQLSGDVQSKYCWAARCCDKLLCCWPQESADSFAGLQPQNLRQERYDEDARAAVAQSKQDRKVVSFSQPSPLASAMCQMRWAMSCLPACSHECSFL